MIVVYSNLLLRIISFGSGMITGIAILPFIILSKDIRGKNESIYILNHERIHIKQQIEQVLIIFAIWYLASFIRGKLKGMSNSEAYRNIIFEKEAYCNMYNLEYLKSRKRFSFLNYK